MPKRTIAFTAATPFPYGGGIFSGKCIDRGPHYGHSYQVVILNHEQFPKGARVPEPGDVWQVTGPFKPHPHHPEVWQLHADTCRMFKPNGKLFFHFLRNNKAFKGLYIGDKKWDGIIAHFQPTQEDKTGPARLKQALDAGDIGVFVDNGLLSAELAGRLISSWRRIDRNEINVVTYLQDKGIDSAMANRLMSVWGEDTIRNLEKNPYYLVAFIDKWRHVDELGRKIYKIAHDDPRRMVAAVVVALKERLIDGKHTLAQHHELMRLVRLRLGTSAKAFLDSAIDLAIAKGVVVGSRDKGYQLDGAEALERRVRQMLEALHFDRFPGQRQLIFTPPSRAFIDQVIAVTESELGFSFNTEQRAAVHMAMTHRLSVLCGGAGCGKTAVLRAILNCVKAINGTFYQMALAGRAAKRIKTATGEEAFTVTRFLYRAWTGELDLAGDPLVIIDEASMIDLTSMDRILRALYRGAKLLFVGDEAQLPPISFGLVFHRLVRSDTIPRTRLTQVVRSSHESGIADIARLIRDKQVPNWNPDEDFPGLIQRFPWEADNKAIPGVFFEPCSEAMLTDKIKEVAEALDDLDNTQVVSVKTEGDGSTKAVNVTIQNWLDERYLETHKVERPTFMPNPNSYWERWALGDRIMYLENDPELDLNNGTLGTIAEVRGDVLICKFEDVADLVEITPWQLSKIALAFSITCHKAQGSQWLRVIIPIANIPHMLDNSWIYTALTRAVDQVVFVGSWQTLAMAIRSQSQFELREVGFSI